MTLPSQSAQSSTTRTHARGGRNLRVTPRTILGAAVLAVVIAGGAWGLGKLVGNKSDAKSDGTQGASLGGDRPGETPGTGLRSLLDTKPTPSEPATTTPATTPGEAPRPRPVDLTNPGVPGHGTPGEVNPAAPGLTPQAGIGPDAGPAAPSPEAVAATEFRHLIDDADRALNSGASVKARELYNKALRHELASDADKAMLRDKLQSISMDLLFSSKIAAGDTWVEGYTVQGGDSYDRIRKRNQLAVDWRLLERLNRTPPSKLKLGQKIKLVHGPFHAIVSKSNYRLDLYTGSPDDPSSWDFVRSFKVGLGENDSTPMGTFVVKQGSKLVNPPWTNPRTGEHFDANDPKCPIGEHWIGLAGLGSTSAFTGYGIHGTIEPDSIGQQRSMGCVRMGAEDVAQVYELLVEGISIVKIEH